ncbi:MAG: multidrug DMT transporter permease [Legionellaceae bacterium]|nr:multidrug DMT transporter permease [Legionellaceae bacterium]
MRILIFLSLCFATLGLPASSLCNPEQCMLVVDAGSSGTRIHLYQYQLHKASQNIQVTTLWSKKIRPGLTQIQANPDSVDAYLLALTRTLPEQNIPLYFYATAGMRMLPEAEQQAYFRLIQDWFSQYYSGPVRSLKTIGGQEEGLYGWLSVNQQLGLLGKSREHQAGVLDMGGASVQLVFPSDTGASTYTLRFFDQVIALKSYSFLGLGQNEMQRQYLENAACYAQEYAMANGEKAHGNAHECVDSLTQLINGVHNVHDKLVPDLSAMHQKRWVAMGSINYTAQAEPLHYTEAHLTLAGLLEAAQQKICSQDWSGLKQQYPSDHYLEYLCLFPSYYYALVVNGYGLSPEQWIEQLPAEASDDWTIGVVVYEGLHAASDKLS